MNAPRWIIAWCLSGAYMACTLAVFAMPPDTTATYPVIARPAAGSSVSSPNGNGTSRPAGPTTPSGKLPQYQLEREAIQLADTTAGPAANRLRFQLEFHHESLVVEVIVKVDGQPYSHIRQARVQQVLKDLTSTVEAIPSADAGPVSASDSLTRSSPAGPEIDAALLSRCQRYAQATGRAPSAREIDWLLTHTIDGPICLWLNDHFQQTRGEQRPEFDVLDRDGDGTVSAVEIAQAADSLVSCDANRNDIVEWKEIAAAATYDRGSKATEPELSASLIAPAMEPSASADLRIEIAFDRVQPEKSVFSLTARSDRWKELLASAVSGPTGLTLELNGQRVIIQVVQAMDTTTDQFSLGAIHDGYPWLPELDRFDDGRITIRELREVPRRLIQFDTNRDGQLTADEAVSPVRLCLAWGAIAHRELANLRQNNIADSPTSQPAPEWFVRMDRNHDQDLTRGEFPGTDEQFKSMDRDEDGLISLPEARVNELGPKAAADSAPPAGTSAATTPE